MPLLPIELICNVTGIALWSVNGTDYTLTELTNGTLPGHGSNGTNILVNSPVNNTEYICVSSTIDGTTRSNPAYVVIAGKYIRTYVVKCIILTKNTLAVKRSSQELKKPG